MLYFALDGDKKAYYENSQYSIEQNKEKIAQLRTENKLLRAKLAAKMQVDFGMKRFKMPDVVAT